MRIFLISTLLAAHQLSAKRFCEKSSIEKVISAFQTQLRETSQWQNDKQKCYGVGANQRRHSSETKMHIKIQDIPTWAEYAKLNDPLPDKIPLEATDTIDSSKNEQLADKISIFRGDITNLEVDVIVNAAKSSLLGGGGVDGAIHKIAGPQLKEECRTLNGCNVGEAKLTAAYKLPSKHVIHTVGPQGEQPKYLEQCYKNSLNIMSTKKLRTIAFPCISTGVYGYPLEPAAYVATMTVRKHLEANGDDVDRVIFCLFEKKDEDVYQKMLQSTFPLK